MAYEDSFGFTHLVEDSDDDDQALDLSNSHLDVDLQPHLSSLETATSITGRSSVEDLAERADDHNHGNSDLSKSFSSAEEVDSRKNESVEDVASGRSGEEPTAAGVNSGLPSNNINGSCAGSGSEPPEPVAVAAPPVQTNVQVQFSNSKGQVQVVQQPALTLPDGSYYINTHGVPQQWSEPERPLTKKRILLLKIFSIVACVFFFPSGIPAAYYAFRIDKEFEEGIMRGNIDQAQKFGKRSEKLTILSMVLSVVFATLIVALVERPYSGSHHHHTSGVAVG
ncbi:hypothetical protein ElyMa_005227300 [Elysia marginata]|uniref:Uncharacterized protein n=1 Tax=Elysia marginata TaxID=1093978 RepID=A0AAV4JZM4_9GAST|nr:hypothetical protein ElyMa_005227300 [Elysia marginata]